MDQIIDSRFERLEKALTSLIDSVNKYHPSASHAQELEAADNELSRCLEEGKSRLPDHGDDASFTNSHTQFKHIRTTTSASKNYENPPPPSTPRSATPCPASPPPAETL